MRMALGAVMILMLAGCGGETPFPRSEADARLFGPAVMRLHPIFTQVKDWDYDAKPDGIEALVELQDRFGDPTKASGRVIFELFEYRPYDPERRGERVANPWIGYLETLDEQQERWNRTSRTYSFQLAYDQIQPTRSYVLTAQFELSGGGRLFDRIILEGKQPENASSAPRSAFPGSPPATAPTGSPNVEPGARSPEP